MPVLFKSGGAYANINAIYVKIGGSYVPANLYIKIAGTYTGASTFGAAGSAFGPTTVGGLIE